MSRRFIVFPTFDGRALRGECLTASPYCEQGDYSFPSLDGRGLMGGCLKDMSSSQTLYAQDLSLTVEMTGGMFV